MDFVNVFLRIKPDRGKNYCLNVVNKSPAIVHILDRPQSYSFDDIFEENVEQHEVYSSSVKPLVDLVIKGFNCTVFAYGQTGSGKTYTVGTESQENKTDRGLVERAIEDFFNSADVLDISVSFVEIYNDKVYDLLKIDNPVPLKVRGRNIKGLIKAKVCSQYEAKQLLQLGNENRHTAETKLNANSSRSHAIFTIYQSSHSNGTRVTAKLNLVDLAGSESVKKTGNQGSTFQEGVNINKGLFYIGQVITALSLNQFVNYRQSLITTILQDSLNRNTYITLIACINPNADDVHETLQTLEFAQRVKRIKNKPEINEIFNEYKQNNPMAFANMKTPLKRSVMTPQKPFSQQKNVVNLNSIKESDSFFEDGSLISSSMTTSEASVQNANLSPVIRKYINEIENTVMTKFGNILQDQLSKMVKSEVALQTVNLTRATSSPLDEEDLNPIRKVLRYNSPVMNEKNEDTFKMPLLPKSRSKGAPKTSSISPIVTESSRRRSIRLSEKENRHGGNIPDFKLSLTTPMLKNNRKLVSYTDNSTISKRRTSSRLLSMSESEKNDSDSLIEEPPTVRRSARMSTRQSLANDLNATRERPLKRTISLPKKYEDEFVSSPPKSRKVSRVQTLRNEEQNGVVHSPKSNHRLQVLNILNKGDLKDLEKLHTVGTKSAERILLQRELNGKFKSFADLSKIPGWTSKRMERFLTQNFVHKQN